MDKQDILKIVIIAIVLIFIVQMAAPGLLGNRSDGPQLSGSIASGTGIFNGTMRTYNPYIFVIGTVNETVSDEIKQDVRVAEVVKDPQGLRINLSVRDDVYQFAYELKKKYNMSSQALANIIPPTQITVYLDNGSVINASTVAYLSYLGPIRLWMEPVVDADSDVGIKLQAIVQGTDLISVANPMLLAMRANVTANATVLRLDNAVHLFTVPWGERANADITSLKAQYGEENVSYIRSNSIEFEGADVSVAEIIEKKATLPYLIYLGASSGDVAENFTDKSRIMADFKDKNVTFSNSTILIRSSLAPALPYNSTAVYTYAIKLPQSTDTYTFDDTETPLNTGLRVRLNSSVEIMIDGVVIGKKIIRIDSVSIIRE